MMLEHFNLPDPLQTSRPWPEVDKSSGQWIHGLLVGNPFVLYLERMIEAKLALDRTGGLRGRSSPCEHRIRNPLGCSAYCLPLGRVRKGFLRCAQSEGSCGDLHRQHAEGPSDARASAAAEGGLGQPNLTVDRLA